MSRGTPIVLTERKIDAMKPGDEIWDTKVTNLHIRAGTRGKSFLFCYTTLSGQKRRPAVGKYGVITLDRARSIAKDWGDLVAQGKDPLQMKQSERAKGLPPTLADLKARYDEEIGRNKKIKEALAIGGNAEVFLLKSHTFENIRKSTEAGYAIYWTHILSFFKADKDAASITKRDIKLLHEFLTSKKERATLGLKGGGAVIANKVVRFLSSVLKTAATDWKILDKTTVEDAIERLPQYKEKKRVRFLEEDEAPRFAAVLKSWETSTWQRRRTMALLVQLCLYTAARKGEFMTARLSWIDWKTADLCLPQSKTTDGEKRIELPAKAVELLTARYNEWLTEGAKLDEDWIIPGKDPKKPMRQSTKGWAAILKKAKIENFHLHDLRHSFATIGISSGAATLDQMRHQLGHSSKEMTERYGHLTGSAKRKVIDATVNKIVELMEGKGEENKGVVPGGMKLDVSNVRQDEAANTAPH